MQNITLPQQLDIINSSTEEINILNSLGEDYKQYSEMSEQDRAFLNTLVLRKQPQRLLELGVCSGGSSLVLLNAIKNINNAHLYSIDYNTQHYKLKDKLTGFYVDNFPELKNKWTLKTGALALDFMEEIGGDIDFCLIDTVHSNPGEILDFLMVLPYLKKDATVVFHDTSLHTRTQIRPKFSEWQITNGLLMSSITGQKLIPADKPFSSDMLFANIGAIELNTNTFEHLWEIFNLLTMKWRYQLKYEETEKIYNFIKQFYGEYYSQYFYRIVQHQTEIKILDSQYTTKDYTKEINNKLNQIIKIIQKLQNKEEEKPSQQLSCLQKFFSVKNENKHKVVCLLGLKLKFKRKGL